MSIKIKKSSLNFYSLQEIEKNKCDYFIGNHWFVFRLCSFFYNLEHNLIIYLERLFVLIIKMLPLHFNSGGSRKKSWAEPINLTISLLFTTLTNV